MESRFLCSIKLKVCALVVSSEEWLVVDFVDFKRFIGVGVGAMIHEEFDVIFLGRLIIVKD